MAPVLEVSWVDPHDTDCLTPEVRGEIARGMVRAEDAVARCEIERRKDGKQIVALKTIALQQQAEIEGLRVWAGLAKGALGFGAAAAVTAAILIVVTALR